MLSGPKPFVEYIKIHVNIKIDNTTVEIKSNTPNLGLMFDFGCLLFEHYISNCIQRAYVRT